MVRLLGSAPSYPAHRASVLLLDDRRIMVEPLGTAPRFPECHSGVFLLDDGPVYSLQKRRVFLHLRSSPQEPLMGRKPS